MAKNLILTHLDNLSYIGSSIITVLSKESLSYSNPASFKTSHDSCSIQDSDLRNTLYSITVLMNTLLQALKVLRSDEF